jgi:hypothetical protein
MPGSHPSCIVHRNLITGAQCMLENNPQGGASWVTSKSKL